MVIRAMAFLLLFGFARRLREQINAGVPVAELEVSIDA